MDKQLYNALERLNYRLSKIGKKRPELIQDIEPYIEINFGGYITKSGRISRRILKNPEPDLLERIEGTIDFVSGVVSEVDNIPDNIYDIWQNAISDYFRFVSEIGMDALRELAPQTTENITELTKENEKIDFWRAVEKWRQEREKVMEYVDSLANAEPYTDF